MSSSYKYIELVVSRTHADGTSVTDFSVQLPSTQFGKTTRVELVASSVSGVPVTGSVPNYPYLNIDIDKLRPHSFTTTGRNGQIVLLLTGDTTVTNYSPARTIRMGADSHTPISLDQLNVKVRLPSDELAESGVDIGGLYLIFRVWQDSA